MADTRYVTLELDNDIFRALATHATQLGISVKQAASNMILEQLESASENSDSPEMRLFFMLNKQKRTESIKSNLLSIARGLQGVPSEDSDKEVEDFISVCQSLGFDATAILAEVAETSSELLIEVSGDAKTQKAIDYLQKRLSGGKAVPSVDIANGAVTLGISKNALGQARKALKVISTRGPAGFTMRLPKAIDIAEDAIHESLESKNISFDAAV